MEVSGRARTASSAAQPPATAAPGVPVSRGATRSMADRSRPLRAGSVARMSVLSLQRVNVNLAAWPPEGERRGRAQPEVVEQPRHDKIGRLLFAQGCNVTARTHVHLLHGESRPFGGRSPSHFLGQQDAGNRPCNTGAATLLGRPQNFEERAHGCAARTSTASSRAQRARTCWGQVCKASSSSSNSSSCAAAAHATCSESADGADGSRALAR